MTRIAFTKGHGTGNDFILFFDPSNELNLSQTQISKICNRHFGLGADGVLIAVFDSVWFMDYRNADGSIAEMCGNGIRVFAEFLYQRNLIASVAHIKTRAGMKRVERVGENTWSVEMGAITSDEISESLRFQDTSHKATSVNVGNPHVVIQLDDFNILPDTLQWTEVETLASHPEGFNLEFYVVNSDTSVSMRVLERGVGETLSCGTGVCAVGYLHMQRIRKTKCEVNVPGGKLNVELQANGICLVGPAELIADGFVEVL
ncbi:MAG: diaminopimelate epimerase [Candidatus Nanopelagicales bacterium]